MPAPNEMANANHQTVMKALKFLRIIRPQKLTIHAKDTTFPFRVK